MITTITEPAVASLGTPLPIAQSFDLPRYFIRGEEGRVYALHHAPTEVFDAWVQEIIEAEEITDPLALFIIEGHRQTWDELARHWAIINFLVRSIDIAKYSEVGIA